MGLALAFLALVTDLDGITAGADDTRTLVGLVLGLGLLGTGLAYILYYVIVDRLGGVTASGATYIPPSSPSRSAGCSSASRSTPSMASLRC